MIATNPTGNGQDSFLEPMLDFWMQSFRQALEPTRAWVDVFRQALEPGALRRGWLDALARSLDAYMRTPAFLEAMRHHFLVLTEAKSQGEDLAQEVAREAGIPRMPDISGLFERMQVGQELILGRLAAIEDRLTALEGQKSPA